MLLCIVQRGRVGSHTMSTVATNQSNAGERKSDERVSSDVSIYIILPAHIILVTWT